jgi:hypothetical protein
LVLIDILVPLPLLQDILMPLLLLQDILVPLQNILRWVLQDILELSQDMLN